MTPYWSPKGWLELSAITGVWRGLAADGETIDRSPVRALRLNGQGAITVLPELPVGDVERRARFKRDPDVLAVPGGRRGWPCRARSRPPPP
jgi:hypothetical protein